MSRSFGKESEYIKSGNLRLHRPFSKEQFEKYLLSVSNFREFHDDWYEIEWILNDKGEYDEIDSIINEYCYIIPIIFDPVRLVKVYSSVKRHDDKSREKGKDAIRIVLSDHEGKPVRGPFRRINRNGNWRESFRLRISEALKASGINIDCPKCQKILLMWRNSKNNTRFFTCSKCDYKRDFSVV